MYSLKDLDVGKACETPFKMEVTDEQGKGVGIFLFVIGAHAPAVQEFTKTSLNERRREDALAEKRDPRGKQVHVRPVEEDFEFGTRHIAVRIVGWEGIEEPYSPAQAVKLCTINPEIKEQVLAVSENLKNFPTRYTAASNDTSDNSPG